MLEVNRLILCTSVSIYFATESQSLSMICVYPSFEVYFFSATSRIFDIGVSLVELLLLFKHEPMRTYHSSGLMDLACSDLITSIAQIANMFDECSYEHFEVPYCGHLPSGNLTAKHLVLPAPVGLPSSYDLKTW